MARYDTRTSLYNTLMGTPGQGYNAIGRTAGASAANGSGDNFFVKRGKSIENAIGTTLVTPIAFMNDRIENDKTTSMLRDNKTRMNDVAKKYGYNTYHDVWDARDKAEAEGDTATLDFIDKTINPELSAVANENAAKATEKAAKYDDYRKNDYISNKINQNNTKFLGSAINTLSTAADVTGVSSTPLSNAIQGGIEGFADEMEQNGANIDLTRPFTQGIKVTGGENFDWGRAGQNALVGAATGAVTGALNKGISSSLAKNGGNLFKGGNALTRGLNSLGSKTALGRFGSTLATGAARGAVSGAVGGATGAGLQSALNGVEFGQGVQNALQGAVQGAQQGAVTGGIMAGANMAISKTPGVGKFYNELQGAKSKWDQSGRNFDERLTNTLTSGDSAFGDWLMKKRQSNVLGAVGNIGNRVQDVSGSDANEYVKSIDPEQQWTELEEVMKRAVDSDTRRLYGASGGNNKLKSEILQTETTNDVLRMANEKLKNNGTYTAYQNGELDDTQYFGAVKDAINSSINDTLNEVELQRATQQTPTTVNKYVGVDTLGNKTEYTPAQLAKLINEYDNYKQPSTLSGNSFDEVSEVVGPAGSELMNIYKTMNGGVPVDPYSRESWGEFESWLNTQRTNTPTTAKGWLKQAGKRIVEDANNRGVGLSINDVSDDIPTGTLTKEQRYQRFLRQNPESAKFVADYAGDNANKYSDAQLYAAFNEMSPEARLHMVRDGWEFFPDEYMTKLLPDDVRNIEIARNDMLNYSDDGTEPITVDDALARAGVERRNNQAPQTQPAVGTTTNAWDRIAQEAGYNNYNEALQRFAEANPNAQVNPNGMAEQVLSWLDQNPNMPTTAKEWARLAGQRAVEDMNERGIGLSVRNVGEEDPSKRLYNALVGKQPTEESPQAEIIEPTNSKKTNTANKLRNAAGLKLQAQYGTIDKPTAKATNAPETLQKIANAGFTKPADVERMADVITGSNGEVSKLVSNLVSTAEPINTFEGDMDGQTIDDFIDLSIQKRGLDGINEGKAVKSQLNALMKSLPSRAEGSITFEDDPANVFKLTQLLDAEAANYEGRSGMNYGTTNPDKLRAAQVIKDVSNLYKNRIYDSADVSKVLTPEVAANLKSYAPDNKAWADYVDNEIMSATSAKDLRSVQAPWVRAKKIIDNGYMNSVTYGGRNSGISNLPLTKRGMIGAVLGATVNSKPGLRAQAKVLNKAADIVGGTSTGAQTNTVAPSTEPTNTATAPTQLYNALSRTQGLESASQIRSGANNTDQQDATASYAAPLGTSIAVPSTSVYNTLSSTPMNQTQVVATAPNSYFQATGDYWTDTLGQAASKAIDDNDIQSFAALYEMYQDSLANTQKQSANQTASLNATQQANIAKLNAADSAIDELESLFEQAGGGKGPIIGNLQSLAGDWGWDSGARTYNDLSEGLVNQIAAAIGKTDSLNTEGEVKRALKLIPQLTDDATTAKNKLEELRRMLATTKASYNSAYGIAQ